MVNNRAKRRQTTHDDNDEHRPTKLLKSSSSSSSSSSSKARTFFTCDICMDRKPLNKHFVIKNCTHSYCSECIGNYTTYKIQEKISQISCPDSGCDGNIDPESCRSILARKVFDKWLDALAESVISASDKYYCPFEECSALLMKGHDFEDIVESECPNCHRLFCAKCGVAWHSGITCGEFQELDKNERERNDILLKELAKNKKWARCSKCKFYVEKTEGCLSMKCRCGYTFCYNCGAHLQQDHYCANCKH